jgi:hypothetical protein
MWRTLVAVLLVTFLAIMTFHKDREAYEAIKAYESARDDLEALQRTRGVIDIAYVCKKR